MARYFVFRKSWFLGTLISRFREISISTRRGFMFSKNLFDF